MDPDDVVADPNPHQSDSTPGAAPSQLAQMRSLTLEVSNDAAGAEQPAGNRSLPADFYETADEIEVTEKGSRLAGGLAGSASRGEPEDWRERSELDGEVLPSPSSSGYAGERGSIGGSNGIEGEADDGGPSLPDDWGRGKRHLDEVTSSWFF
ncbi:hypothetical protein BHE74_00044056 [Ensete ventricosum]|nr:hypothetical protein BHE74_00044056 [Ensete ventricosum]